MGYELLIIGTWVEYFTTVLQWHECLYNANVGKYKGYFTLPNFTTLLSVKGISDKITAQLTLVPWQQIVQNYICYFAAQGAKASKKRS